MSATFQINGQEVKPGLVIPDFRGENWVFVQITKLSGGPSQGKIEVTPAAGSWRLAGHAREFYPSVFGGEIVVIEDGA